MNQTDIAIKIFNHLLADQHRDDLLNAHDRHETLPPWFPQGTVVSSGGIGDKYNEASSDNEMIILGDYTPMASPARVCFYRDNISQYSATLIRALTNSGVALGLDSCLFTIYLALRHFRSR